MTLQEQKEKQRKFLMNELTKLKQEGLRVFINKPNQFHDAYGMISDNTNILDVYLANDIELLLRMSFCYTKSKKNGSGCDAMESSKCYTCLTKELFEKSVRVGYSRMLKYGATPYKNLEEYFKKEPYNTEQYIEL